MKKIMLIGLLSLSATAFSQTCTVDMVDRYDRVVRSFRSYGDPNTCLESMKECRKSIRLDYSNNPRYPNGSLNCVRRGGYNPTPTPNPYPTPNYGVSVSGVIEDRAFTFVARDPSELYINCLSDIRRVNYGSADELFFTANNNRFVSTATSGWYNDTTICSILEQEARRSFRTEYTSSMRVVGSLERAPFQIEAYDRASLLTSCIDAFAPTRQGSTDELTYSLNGAPFQRISTSGWWNTPARACKAMILSLDAQIR